MNPVNPNAATRKYNLFLLLVAGLGGLLFGVDVGIISGALPYLEATFKNAATGQPLTSNQLSFIVAAVLLGGVFSTAFAGPLADWLGRKRMMIFSGILFVVSVPMIALSNNYDALVLGRLLQGVSGGLIGVVVPLYLAECLAAADRGKGTGVFQWLLTFGIVAAALIGWYFSGQVEAVAKLGDPAQVLAFKDHAWRNIFWVSLPPGLLFVVGSFFVAESPRWLFRRGRPDAARAALLRSRDPAQADLELKEMAETAAPTHPSGTSGESLLQRKYVVPFLLACVILACNQATGINSIIGYNTTILIQAGLSDQQAHLGYVLLTAVNFLMTIVAIALVDRQGRKFLLSVGTAGVILSLLATGLLFRQTEQRRVDVQAALQSQVVLSKATLDLHFSPAQLKDWLPAPQAHLAEQPCTLVVVYSYGPFTAASKVVRSDDPDAHLSLDRSSCLPDSSVSAFFKNPFADLAAARTAPLVIQHAIVTPVPAASTGWLTAGLIYCFIAFFAMGPGVCVWLALSELMPTRIRSTGISIALLLNTAVSTGIAAVFLPTVGQYGYSTMFFGFAGCTVIYFLTAAFILPETKGKTLEEIEEHFGTHH